MVEKRRHRPIGDARVLWPKHTRFGRLLEPKISSTPGRESENEAPIRPVGRNAARNRKTKPIVVAGAQ